MASTDLSRVRYAGLDFDTIEDELRARLQVNFAASFNDFAVSSLGIVLLDVIAYGLDTLSFYLDRRATDTYLSTARSRRSIALLTRQLGYKMSGAVAASVDLAVAPKQAYTFPIPIIKGFQFQGPGNAIFETAQPVILPANSISPLLIPCYQGQTVTETFVSSGNANQLFNLARVPAGMSVVEGTVQVFANGTPFSESDFLTYDATNQFEVGYNSDPPTIRFGDGVAGNIPAQNASIAVTYVATLGASGGAISGAITTSVTGLLAQGQTIGLTINNPAASVGGSDLEDLDHAKIFAPKVFKARKVAVTRGDYEALAGAFVDPLFGRVAAAQAISARSADQDVELLNQTGTIRSDAEAIASEVTTALSDPAAGAQTLASTIASSLTAIQTSITTLTAKLNTISGNLTNTLTAARTTKSNAAEAATDYSDAHTSILVSKANITTFRGAVASLASAGSSALTSADSTSFLAYIDGISSTLNHVDSLMGLINSLASTIGSNADLMTTQTQQAQSLLTNDIGLSTSTTGSLLFTMATAASSGTAAIGVPTAPATALFAQLQAAIFSSSSRTADIITATEAIEEHVDEILAEDCAANLVVVPILARDSSGFYAAPSNGLIRSVQSYLDGIKEVTQTVKVTSGANFLVPAALRVRMGVNLGTSEQVVQATATTVIDGILRDRAFGVSLYLSDLVNPLRGLSGVAFVNITIFGYRPLSGSILTDKIDSDGNLIIDTSEVVTLSSSDLTITTEVVTTS